MPLPDSFAESPNQEFVQSPGRERNRIAEILQKRGTYRSILERRSFTAFCPMQEFLGPSNWLRVYRHCSFTFDGSEFGTADWTNPGRAETPNQNNVTVNPNPLPFPVDYQRIGHGISETVFTSFDGRSRQELSDPVVLDPSEFLMTAADFNAIPFVPQGPTGALGGLDSGDTAAYVLISMIGTGEIQGARGIGAVGIQWVLYKTQLFNDQRACLTEYQSADSSEINPNIFTSRVCRSPIGTAASNLRGLVVSPVKNDPIIVPGVPNRIRVVGQVLYNPTKIWWEPNWAASPCCNSPTPFPP